MRKCALLAFALCFVLFSCGGTDTANPSDNPDGDNPAIDGDGEDCPTGTRHCPCYGNGTCNEGLVCQDDLCLASGNGGDGDTDDSPPVDGDNESNPPVDGDDDTIDGDTFPDGDSPADGDEPQVDGDNETQPDGDNENGDEPQVDGDAEDAETDGDTEQAEQDLPCACTGGVCCDGCNYLPDGNACNDGEDCTYNDHCNSAGACVGTSISCEDDPTTCGANRACDGSDTCVVTYPGNETTCDDQDLCSHTDLCNGNGTCVGTPYGCNDHGDCNGDGTCNCDTGYGGDTCTEEIVYNDPDTGLQWELFEEENSARFEQAVEYCEELELAGCNDWRLPTATELRSLLRGCPNNEPGGTCQLGETCTEFDECYDAEACAHCGCYDGPSPRGYYWPDVMDDTLCDAYWTSTEIEYCELSACWETYYMVVGFCCGDVNLFDISHGFAARIRCVRTAQ